MSKADYRSKRAASENHFRVAWKGAHIRRKVGKWMGALASEREKHVCVWMCAPTRFPRVECVGECYTFWVCVCVRWLRKCDVLMGMPHRGDSLISPERRGYGVRSYGWREDGRMMVNTYMNLTIGWPMGVSEETTGVKAPAGGKYGSLTHGDGGSSCMCT